MPEKSSSQKRDCNDLEGQKRNTGEDELLIFRLCSIKKKKNTISAEKEKKNLEKMQLGDQAACINGMLRAEKINMANAAWLWKETNIWSRAACQSFDRCEKSGKKLYVLTDHPKALLAFPGAISLMLKNILEEHKRTFPGQKHKPGKSKQTYFSKN